MVSFKRVDGTGPDYRVSIQTATGNETYVFTGVLPLDVTGSVAIQVCRNDPRLEEVS